MQGVVHNINKDTICPEGFMIEGLAQFHLFFKSPVTNVPAEISCWPGFSFLTYELQRTLSCSPYGQCMAVLLSGVCYELMVMAEVRT